MPSRPSNSSAQRDEVREGKNVVRVAFLGTPLYEEPDEASAKLAYLNKGTLLEVRGECQDFSAVRIRDGVTGYVRRSGVVPTSVRARGRRGGT